MKRNIQAIDIARGLSILLVVAHHSILYLDANDQMLGFIPKLNSILAYIRMPTFFLISGVLAGSALRRPWREFITKKIFVLFWVFAVWSVIRYAYFGNIYPNIRDEYEGHSLSYLITQIYDPRTGIWFLWALMIFFVIAKVVAPVNRVIVIGIAAVLSVLAFGDAIPILSWSQMNVPKYALFFLAGSLFADDIKANVERVGLKLFGIGAITFVIAIAAIEILDGAIEWPIEVIACATGVGAGLGGATLIAKTRVAAGALTFFGRRTLPIYVAHVPIVATVADLLTNATSPNIITCVAILASVVVIAVSGSLLLETVLLRGRLKWFYSPPQFISSLLERGFDRRATV